jgi:hypothetical protein
MNLRILLSVFIIFLVLAMLPAKAQSWRWARSNGGSGNESTSALTTDSWGNIYAAGYYSSTSFNFSFFPMNNAGSGYTDVFLVKYSPDGTVLWAASAGGNNDDYVTSVSTDPWGNVFIAGYFFSTTFTIGGTTLSNAGATTDSSDMFVAKFDSLGNFKWARRAGGVKDDRIYSMMADISGNVIVTGSFQSAYLAFGTGAADTVKNPIEGVDRVFVIKYDSLGNYVWYTSAGGVGYDFGYALATDPGNNIYVSGAFNSSNITFGTTVLNNTSSVDDMFLVKYDSMGTVLWARSGAGSANDIPTAARADNYGNIYVTGKFSSPTLTFGTATLTNAGATGYDIFLVKYDLFGNFVWARSNGGNADDIPHAIAIDDSSYIVLAGNFASTSLPFGPSTLTYDGTGLNALFMGKYDSAGHALWGITTGPHHGNANGIAVSYPSQIYMGGDFSDTTFWFGNDTLQNIIHTGTADMFLAKFSQTPLSVPSVAANGTGITIYPNPNNGMMTVSLGVTGYNTLAIYNAIGQQVYQGQLSGNETALKINAMDMNDGVYMLRASRNGVAESATFVIRR